MPKKPERLCGSVLASGEEGKEVANAVSQLRERGEEDAEDKRVNQSAARRKGNAKTLDDGPPPWVHEGSTTPEFSLTLPVFQPPDLEIMEYYRSKRWGDREKEHVKKITDVTVTRQFEDVMMENIVLRDYGVWIWSTRNATASGGEKKTEEFYDGLLEKLEFDLKETRTEKATLWEYLGPDGFDDDDFTTVDESLFIRPKPNRVGEPSSSESGSSSEEEEEGASAPPSHPSELTSVCLSCLNEPTSGC